jgi:hypothetical protein
MDRDKAYTPAPLARAIVRELIQPRLRRPDRFWEPCCGAGAFADPLSELLPGAATDLDPDAPYLLRDGPRIPPAGQIVYPVYTGCQEGAGPLPGPLARVGNSVIVVTNPPYSAILPLLQSWLQEPRIRLIGLLLLQSWIVPHNRRDLVWGPIASIRAQTVLYPRPKFFGSHLGNNSFSQESCFLIWERGTEGWNHKNPISLDRLEWKNG